MKHTILSALLYAVTTAIKLESTSPCIGCINPGQNELICDAAGLGFGTIQTEAAGVTSSEGSQIQNADAILECYNAHTTAGSEKDTYKQYCGSGQVAHVTKYSGTFTSQISGKDNDCTQ